ncbi:hypothetical protein BDF22DRAFT_776877 [Syncephalis plumigaleata]|nr:hypothetical protein BDF22DRAFT_776877 [Syncephalis plumigaleata]
MFCYRNTSKFVALVYFAVLIGSAVPLHALPASQSEQVPVAKTKPFQHKYHGEVIDDPYQWIKDEGRNSTDVKEYLNAETAYTHRMLAKDQQLKDQIYSEIVKVSKSKEEALALYRKKLGSENAPEELIVDPNTLPEDKIENTDSTIEWSGTGKSILYTIDGPDGPRLMRHTIGTSADKDSVIHTGQKESSISVKKSSSNQYLFINISKENGNQQHFYLDATNDTASKMVPIEALLSPGSALEVYHLNKQFLLVAESKDTKKKTAYVCDVDKLNDKSAHKPVLENVNFGISSIAAFRNHIVLFDEVALPRQVTIYDYAAKEDYSLMRNHIISILVIDHTSNNLFLQHGNEEGNEDICRSSTDYNESDYVTELIYAKGKPDSKGNQPDIPITIAYKRGMQKNGANPAWLISNGGTLRNEMGFRKDFAMLLKRGFVCVVVHNRRITGKTLAAGEPATIQNDKPALVKYTNHNLMVVEGFLDGATVVATALNRQPDIAKVAIIDTWTAKSINDYKAIRAFSPYENIKPNTAYPNVLVVTYFDNPNVAYWDSAKWVAKLRATAAQSANKCPDPRTIVMISRNDEKLDHSFLSQDAAKIAYALSKLGKAVKPLNLPNTWTID